MQKSKLELILCSLANKSNVKIIAIEEKRYYSAFEFKWIHLVNIIVAPPETILDTTRLQSIMINLVPQVEPSKRLDFNKKTFFDEFGYLVFKETVVADFSEARYVNHLSNHEIDRQIIIHLVPNKEVGMAIFKLSKQSQEIQ